MNDNRTQLVVIGGGPGGYAAAFLAGDLGMEVTLVDPRENPGGVCLYEGCIPSKALLHVAKVIGEARTAREWGVTYGEPKIDVEKLRGWKNDVVEKLTGGLGQLVQRRKIHHVRGTAAFSDDHTLSIGTLAGEKQALRFEQAIIATGSHPVAVPGFDFDSKHVIHAEGALSIPDIPKKLLVVGGGYIGLELGSFYAAIGSKVTVVEMTPNLLPGVDRDLVRVLQKQVRDNFENIFLQTMAKEPKVKKDGVHVTLSGEECESKNLIFDKVLVAVGRRPNTKGIGLEKAGVEIDDRGFIKTDDQRRTAARHIFAIGDVAGDPMLAHKASYEGRLAVEVISGKKSIYDPAAVPAVVFTDPEIACAGLSESEAKEKGIAHQVVRFPWGASGRAATMGHSEGMTKMIVDTETERILGIAMVGSGAGELVAESVLAIEMAANVTDVALSIHPHPTLSETIKEAAEGFHGNATHYYRPKRKGK